MGEMIGRIIGWLLPVWVAAPVAGVIWWRNRDLFTRDLPVALILLSLCTALLTFAIFCTNLAFILVTVALVLAILLKRI